jgi:hypothetical protein
VSGLISGFGIGGLCCTEAVLGMRDLVEDDDDVGRSTMELLLPSFDNPLLGGWLGFAGVFCQ